MFVPVILIGCFQKFACTCVRYLAFLLQDDIAKWMRNHRLGSTLFGEVVLNYSDWWLFS